MLVGAHVFGWAIIRICTVLTCTHTLQTRINGQNDSLQVNYLIDEAVNTGKGANSIISMLHRYLENHSLGVWPHPPRK